jgi:hypothetical protein
VEEERGRKGRRVRRRGRRGERIAVMRFRWSGWQ